VWCEGGRACRVPDCGVGAHKRWAGMDVGVCSLGVSVVGVVGVAMG